MLIGLAPSVVIGEAIPFSLTYHSESWTDDANSANPSFAGMAIGDAHKGGRIGDAVHQAYAAVRAVCATGAPALQLAC